jgi:hypothetical protein
MISTLIDPSDHADYYRRQAQAAITAANKARLQSDEYRPASLTTSTSPAPTRWPTGRRLESDFWTTAVFDTLRDYGNEAMRITSLVNSVAKLGNYSRRADYDCKRIELFRLVGRLIRTCQLDRVGRKHVTIPLTNARRQAFLAEAVKPVDFPPANI